MTCLCQYVLYWNMSLSFAIGISQGDISSQQELLSHLGTYRVSTISASMYKVQIIIMILKFKSRVLN